MLLHPIPTEIEAGVFIPQRIVASIRFLPCYIFGVHQSQYYDKPLQKVNPRLLASQCPGESRQDLYCLSLHFRQICSMSSYSESVEELKNIHTLVDTSSRNSQAKMLLQQKIYQDLHKVFHKSATKIAEIATAIAEQSLPTPQPPPTYDEISAQYYKMLSDSLARLADCSMRVANRFKIQILDPLKTFSENYDNLYADIRRNIADRIEAVATQDQQTNRQKENYSSANEKFEKHRENQKKAMEKIENGSKNELEKINQTTKKLTETICTSEKAYSSAVQKLNLQWDLLRKEFSVVSQSISYNEETRLAFLKKSILTSLKSFEEFNNVYDKDTVTKLEESGKGSNSRQEEPSQRKIRKLLEKVINNDVKEEFTSFQDMMKIKKRKGNDEESMHYNQYFSKIKEKQRKLIQQISNQWFLNANRKANQPESPKKEISETESKASHKSKPSNNSDKKKQKTNKTTRDIDQCKQKILSIPAHSMYFIEDLYQRITELKSFYCKLNEENFFFLLNAFTVITKNLDQSDVGIEFLYKMMVVSLRIMHKKQASGKPSENQHIELLCHTYGRNSPKFKDAAIISKLLTHLQKEKALKKKHSGDNKSGLNTIAKGFFAALTAKKSPTLNEDEQYSCLQQLVLMISNFSVPTEVILPFIKQTLGYSYKSSYDHLKNIILSRKDVEERKSLFYKKEVKEKKEELLKKALDNKKMGEYAIKIVAQSGFLSKQQLNFRLICKDLKDVHLQILAKLNIPIQQKWIKLIPVNKKLDYIQMKQEVAQNSVPSAIEQIISLDVHRSLHLHGESLNPTILHSLLRIYAYFHKDISYCQGMNYLAGYIYIKTMNEEHTYRIFEYLMQVRFRQLFVNEFEVLKVKMYQFERLVSIFHPQISDHFKKQAISPQFYIVSWIITLFSSSYQYTLSSHIIDFLWERFIIWGWPEFFRFVLWIFSLYKEELVELAYDRALHFLGELPRSEFFLADTAKFKAQFGATTQNPNIGIERYQVSQQLLNRFAQEYKYGK